MTQEDPQDSREESVVEQPARTQRTTAATAQKKTKNDLIAELAERDAQIAELFELIADLRSQQETATLSEPEEPDQRPAPENIPKDKRSVKLPDPPIFYNEDKKDTMKFEVWHRQMRKKLSVNHDHFVDDDAKQAYIESRLGGKAADELMPYLRDTHPDQIDSPAKLMTHLWNEYYDPNQAEKALDEFAELKLRSGGDYQAFKNNFVRLAGETGQPRTKWKTEFKRRLPTTLQIALAAAYIDPNVTFEQLAQQGANIALVEKQASAERDPPRTRGGATRGSRAGAQRSRPGTSRPVQGDRATPKLTADDFKKLYEEGRCFICREQGHLSRECPRKGRKESRAADPNREAHIALLWERWSARTPVDTTVDSDSEAKN